MYHTIWTARLRLFVGLYCVFQRTNLIEPNGNYWPETEQLKLSTSGPKLSGNLKSHLRALYKDYTKSFASLRIPTKSTALS